MKKPMFFRVISLLIVTLLVLSGIAIAEGVQTADVEFAATETGNNMVKLTLKVKNARFMVFQTALKYDSAVVQPASKSGNFAHTFEEFASLTGAGEYLNLAGSMIDMERGLFGFAYFILPGTTGDIISDKAELIAGEDGEIISTFLFKRVGEGDPGFAVVTSEETDFAPAVKQGVSIMDFDNGALPVRISYEYQGEEKEEEVMIPPVPEVKPEVEEPQFTSADRKKDVILLKIGRSLTIANGKKEVIDPDNNLVVPYIKNDRTLVPLRFIAETLGAEVLWEEGWDGCIIKKDETEIKITFGSADFEVNGETVTYDAPIEVVHDRTMVPIRFVSENLGCDVYWNEKNQAVVLSPADNPWVADREAEQTALGEMLVSLLPIMQ